MEIRVGGVVLKDLFVATIVAIWGVVVFRLVDDLGQALRCTSGLVEAGLHILSVISWATGGGLMDLIPLLKGMGWGVSV